MDKNGWLLDLAESERTEFGRVEFSSQTDAQKVFSAIWDLESQVNDGGFDQYLRNADLDVIEYAPRALREIRATTCASVVESAIQLISQLPVDRHARSKAIDDGGEDVEERLNELDSQFFAYPDNLTDLLFAFVAEHPREFGSIPI